MIRFGMWMIAVVMPAIGLCAAAPAPAPRPATMPATSPSQEVDPAITEFLKRVEPASGDSELLQKLKERHNTAVQLLQLRVEEYRKGIEPLSAVFDTARLVAEAKVDLAQSDDDRVKAAQQILDVSKVIEARLEKQYQSGFGSMGDLERAKLARLTAEVELMKLKQPKDRSTTPTPTGPTAPATRP